MYGYLFELILAFLALGNREVSVLEGPFLRSKFPRNAQNIQWAQNSIFSMENIFWFIDKFLKFGEKFEMWPALCKTPSFFQQWNLN